MKKQYFFIAMAIVVAFTIVSCKNKTQEPTQNEIQEQKAEIRDDVLERIDAFANDYIKASDQVFNVGEFELTAAEKKHKPDYLLDPSESNKLITRLQKTNAMAIYMIEVGVRKMYGIPTDETKEVINKLAADIGYPLNPDVQPSENIKNAYKICKDRGDMAYFWAFQDAMVKEINYIIANNPDLFFSKVTEPQWQAFYESREHMWSAIEELAPYDTEASAILARRNDNRLTQSGEEWKQVNSSLQTAKEFHMANKEEFIKDRNALLIR